MREEEESKEEKSFIGALIAKFRERDDSDDVNDVNDAFSIEQEEDAFSNTRKTLTQKRTDGTVRGTTTTKKKKKKENVKALIDRSFWWREEEETENEDDC